ncbi:hypothetical protein Droror1_Dr00024356 [Drosera rotundifolia]
MRGKPSVEERDEEAEFDTDDLVSLFHSSDLVRVELNLLEIEVKDMEQSLEFDFFGVGSRSFRRDLVKVMLLSWVIWGFILFRRGW